MEKKFDFFEKFTDADIDTLYKNLRMIWYFINERSELSVRVQDEFYNAFSSFCLKISDEYGKRHGF